MKTLGDPAGMLLAFVDFAVRLVRSCTAMLLAVSLVPVLFGWRSEVVVSGSMAPRLRPGDVVVSQPVPASRLRPGQVVLVENPARPGTTLLHRLVRRDADGNLITRGDANAADDTTPVPPAMARGLPRLRVPYVGLPVVLKHQGAVGPLVLSVLIGMVVLVIPVFTAPRVAAVDEPPVDRPTRRRGCRRSRCTHHR